MEQIHRIELSAQDQDLNKDVEAEYGCHASAGLHFDDVTDHIGQGVDRRDPQVRISGERHSQCHEEKRDTVEQDPNPPLGQCAFSHNNLIPHRGSR